HEGKLAGLEKFRASVLPNQNVIAVVITSSLLFDRAIVHDYPQRRQPSVGWYRCAMPRRDSRHTRLIYKLANVYLQIGQRLSQTQISHFAPTHHTTPPSLMLICSAINVVGQGTTVWHLTRNEKLAVTWGGSNASCYG